MTYQHLPDADGYQSDQDSSHRHRTSDSDVPPAYALENPTPTTAPTPQKAASPSKENDKAPVQPEYSYTFSKYESNQEWGGMTLEIVPDPRTPEYERTSWAGAIRVRTQDVARLMREGFFWSAENILPEEGCMFHATGGEWRDMGFHYARTWTLADKSNGDNPRWVAQIDIITPFFELLPRFQVENLSRENVWTASAWNGLQQFVYQYDYHWPAYNYNCIYGDMPLQGWWPWPREDGSNPDVHVPDLAVYGGHTGAHRQPSGCVML
ncbi:hypothetical protein C8A00DRAFT_14332 [Chaetomidium leptoderma]|uniref:Uncharacterized protein n=1 Tax=Chaetomidium leptoderma TaxID=669021 RepID=A0AAN6VNT3_9PEZI|nr:hypothetical protein C8A00DRAFT_14332 [Chaetomidium leptoderma]